MCDMWKRSLILTILSLALGFGTAITLRITPSPAHPLADLVIYDDALAAGWDNWSWNTSVDFNNASPVRSGSRSMAVDYTAAWAGLSLRTGAPINTSVYPTLTFWVHGGSGTARLLRVFIHETDSSSSSSTVDITADVGVWKPITVPLSQLGNPTQIARVNIADRSGTDQAVFYIDDLRFVQGTPPPPPPPPPPFTATIQIQAAGGITPFHANMLGSNVPAWLNPGRLSNATFRARTAASGLTLLRMPGGSWSNGYGWLSCEKGSDQPGAVPCYWTWAARPTDFINFLKATGMRGMWTVSPNGTSKEAAAAVAFFNGYITDTRPIGTDIKGTNWYTVGHWAQLRAAGGNPQPIGIKLWEFGNEMYASKASKATPTSSGLCQTWAWEDTWTCDGAEYVNGWGSGANRKEGYLEFRAAMRAVDPTITLGAVGLESPGTPSDTQANWDTFAGWGSRVISAAGASLDWYTIHPYPFFTAPGSMQNALANPQTHWPTIMSRLRTAFNTYANGRQAPVAVTEFNLFSVQDNDNGQWMTRVVNMLVLADSIGRAAQEGVTLFTQWDLANGRPPNGTEYGLMHEDNNYYRAPQYYVYPLWSRFGSQMLPLTSTFNAATEVSAYAGRVNSNTLSLLAINKTGSLVTATINVAGFGPLIGATLWQVTGASLSAQAVAYNGSSSPSDGLTEAPLTLSAAGNSLTRALPPYSINLLHLQRTPMNVQQRVWLPVARR